VFLVLFLIGPTAQILSLSLIDKNTGALTLAAFVRIINGGPYLAVLSTTFSVALWTTVLCLGLGYPVPIGCAASRRGSSGSQRCSSCCRSGPAR